MVDLLFRLSLEILRWTFAVNRYFFVLVIVIVSDGTINLSCTF